MNTLLLAALSTLALLPVLPVAGHAGTHPLNQNRVYQQDYGTCTLTSPCPVPTQPQVDANTSAISSAAAMASAAVPKSWVPSASLLGGTAGAGFTAVTPDSTLRLSAGSLGLPAVNGSGAGAFGNITVDAQGRITAAHAPTPSDISGLFGDAAGHAIQGGGPANSLLVTATGSSAARTTADRASDQINVLDYGADPTGTTDSTGDFANAETAACSSTPAKAVWVPHGDFLFNSNLTASCDGLTITGDNWTATIGAADVSAPLFLKVNGVDNFELDNVTITSANLTSTNTAIAITAPVKGWTFNNVHFEGLPATAIQFGAEAGPQVTTAAASTWSLTNPPSTLTVTSIPSGLHVGAYAQGGDLLPTLYITGISGDVITLNKPINDTVLSGSTIRFSNAATSTATANVGTNAIVVDSVNAIGAGNTAWSPTGCIPKNDRVSYKVGNTSSVVLEKPLVCTIPAGSNIAFAMGISDWTLNNVSFQNLGMQFLTGTPVSFSTAASAASGSNQLTFDAIGSTVIGLRQGNETAATGLPTGIPAGDMVTNRTINGDGTYTVTLASPLTAAVPSGTSVPWATNNASGNGYGLWNGYGGFFAVNNGRILNLSAEHVFSTPLFLNDMGDVVVDNYRCSQDFQQTSSVAIAPSPCIESANTVRLTVSNSVGSGATGEGMEIDNNYGDSFVNDDFHGNGLSGLALHAGIGTTVTGGRYCDNGQAPNAQLTWLSPESMGISLHSTVTATQPGYGDGTVTGVVACDDQASPTQQYGISVNNAAGVFSVKLNANQTFGNTVADVSLYPPSFSNGTATAGTAPTNESGSVTESGAQTSETITWTMQNGPPFDGNTPVCTVSSPSGASITGYTATATRLVISHASASNAVLNWQCH